MENILKKPEVDDSIRSLVLSRLCFFETNPRRQIERAEKLYEFSKKSENVDAQFNAYYFKGTAYREIGDFSEAMQAFMHCLGLAKEPHIKSEVLEAIATLYKANDDWKNSVGYYRKAIIILLNVERLDAREAESLALSYLNIGDLFLVYDYADSALFYTQKAVEIYDSLQSDVAGVNLAYAIGNEGLAYALKGNHELAEIKIQKSVDYLIVLKDYYAVSVYYTYMADIYMAKGDFQRALQYARESYMMAHEYGLKEQIRDANKKLYELYKEVGQSAKALIHHENYLTYKDSLANIEMVQRLAYQRTEYEVGQKQIEVDLLTAEKRNQQLILIGVIAFAVVLVLLALVVYNFYRSKARINKVLEKQKSELESLNSTKDKFFSIISHDLRGPVSSFFGISRMIKFLVEAKETDQLIEIADDIDQSVERLSSLLDNLLSWAMQQQGQVPFSPEKLSLKEVIEDQVATFHNMAESKKITLHSELSGDVWLHADKNMTQTILRNLVNNALKFTPEEGKVTLSGERQNGTALVKVSDTGVGIPQDKLNSLFNLQDKKSTYGTSGEKGLGLGLQLVHEFVGLHEGSLRVESQEGHGTTFMISLPTSD